MKYKLNVVAISHYVNVAYGKLTVLTILLQNRLWIHRLISTFEFHSLIGKKSYNVYIGTC